MSKFAFHKDERLTGVTLRNNKTGTVLQRDFPAIHPDVHHVAGQKKWTDWGNVEDGFSTTRREHVNRKEAMKIARRSDQTTHPNFDSLGTEDLKKFLAD